VEIISLNYRTIHQLLLEIQPDLVHAMRIPWEGVLASLATPSSTPLIISVWGNDFTLWGKRSPLIAYQTRSAVKRANALHTDCERDMLLAREWGFDGARQQLVVPGAGGINLDVFSSNVSALESLKKYSIPKNAVVILNPRGIRNYVRNEVFFAALVDVIKECDNIYVLCTGMQGNEVIERWVEQRNLQQWVQLLPTLPHERMVELYRMAQISVSPSEHDGTPNSLLEAMAIGCFIVAGDIESVREWITDGYNGLLCNPADIESLARSLILAVQDKELRERAKLINRKIVEERAEYSKTMQRVANFYNVVTYGNDVN
jgi:glycosyltransferase involved in cell wall biosynthesis